MKRSSLAVALALAVSTALSTVALSSPGVASSGGHKVRMLDDCEPVSFNAAVGAGTCVGHGDTTFGDFISELSATQNAEDWKFKPSMLTIRAGRPVILENRGGETHTFTLVESFGGGFVGALNGLSGNDQVAGECAATLPDGSLAPQPPSPVNVFVSAKREAAFKTSGLAPGTYRFQCCIHPWMRVVLTVR